VLGEADGLGGDDLLAVIEGLPGGPPGAVELDAIAGAAGELVERDAERGGQALGDVERGLLLAALVAVDLAQVDAGAMVPDGFVVNDVTRKSTVLIDATSVKREREWQAVVEAIKPPRLNFARRSLYCLERDCDSAECEAMYARSRWGVCPECDGRGEGDEVTSVLCNWCIFGVVELVPVGVVGLVELG
jgi:hypothetical protein